MIGGYDVMCDMQYADIQYAEGVNKEGSEIAHRKIYMLKNIYSSLEKVMYLYRLFLSRLGHVFRARA